MPQYLRLSEICFPMVSANRLRTTEIERFHVPCDLLLVRSHFWKCPETLKLTSQTRNHFFNIWAYWGTHHIKVITVVSLYTIVISHSSCYWISWQDCYVVKVIWSILPSFIIAASSVGWWTLHPYMAAGMKEQESPAFSIESFYNSSEPIDEGEVMP